jgi:hypothetical protein
VEKKIEQMNMEKSDSMGLIEGKFSGRVRWRKQRVSNGRTKRRVSPEQQCRQEREQSSTGHRLARTG